MAFEQSVEPRSGNSLATNKVLANTYRLLSMTLLFAGAIALLANVFNWPHPMYFAYQVTGMPFAGMILVLAIWYGLLYMIRRNQNSAKAIGWVFAFAGFTGYMAGALINSYVTALPNGYNIVAASLFGTGAIFLGCSFYVRMTGRDFSGMGKWLFMAILITFVAGIIAFAFQLQGLSLLVSVGFLVLMSCLILWQTSDIIHGRETNYIAATVTLYVAIYNIFSSLMHLLGAFGGDD